MYILKLIFLNPEKEKKPFHNLVRKKGALFAKIQSEEQNRVTSKHQSLSIIFFIPSSWVVQNFQQIVRPWPELLACFVGGAATTITLRSREEEELHSVIEEVLCFFIFFPFPTRFFTKPLFNFIKYEMVK